MKIFMNPEIYPDFQKLSASFKDPMLYVYPIIQHDCFGYHEIINIEMIERATLSSIDQYIEKFLQKSLFQHFKIRIRFFHIQKSVK